MSWDKLPPTRVEDCPHRSVAAAGNGDETAVCDLLVQAGLPHSASAVGRDACDTCLAEFPPRPDCWNTTVASLVFIRSGPALGSSLLEEPSRKHLLGIRDRASRPLATAGQALSVAERRPQGKPLARCLRELLPPPKPRLRRGVR